MNTLLFIGTTELLLIGGLALLLFGGKKLPEMMRGLGKGVKEFKTGLNEPLDAQPQQEDGDAKQDGDKAEGQEGKPNDTDTPQQQ